MPRDLSGQSSNVATRCNHLVLFPSQLKHPMYHASLREDCQSCAAFASTSKKHHQIVVTITGVSSGNASMQNTQRGAEVVGTLRFRLCHHDRIRQEARLPRAIAALLSSFSDPCRCVYRQWSGGSKTEVICAKGHASQ